MLVKLQRPPPEMRILRPGWALCSRRRTRRLRCPATAAHMSPAAPAPRTMTSNSGVAGGTVSIFAEGSAIASDGLLCGFHLLVHRSDTVGGFGQAEILGTANKLNRVDSTALLKERADGGLVLDSSRMRGF